MPEETLERGQSVGSSQRGHGGTRPDALVGKVLGGRFKLLEVLARGGMGKVYLATQSPLNRKVAVKILDLAGGSRTNESVFRERFFLEASTCAQLNHPNTVRIYDYGNTWDDVFYIAMEYLEGNTLDKVSKSEGSLAPLRAIQIFKQICGSLHEAHASNIIHRDLKPSNIYLTRHGDKLEHVKVLDFGLVKRLSDDAEMTDAGRLMGSPMYMSPEQVQGEKLDVRTDIYSIGVLMYVVLTGERPFPKTKSVSVLLSQINDPPRPFRDLGLEAPVPKNLEWVVMRCLEKDKTARFENVMELLKALKACEVECQGRHPEPFQLSLSAGKTVLPECFTVETLGLAEDGFSAPWTTDSIPPRSFSESRSKSEIGVAAGLSLASLALIVALGAVALVLMFLLYEGFSGAMNAAPVVNSTQMVTTPEKESVNPVTGPVADDTLAEEEPTSAPVHMRPPMPNTAGTKDRKANRDASIIAPAKKRAKRARPEAKLDKKEKVRIEAVQEEDGNGNVSAQESTDTPESTGVRVNQGKEKPADPWEENQQTDVEIIDPWAAER